MKRVAKRARAQPRREPGKMNRTESAYAEFLENLRIDGVIDAWRFEPIKLRLADRTFYEPDFMLVTAEGLIELHEVKGRPGAGPGGWMDDARVKIKVAAEMYEEFLFVGASKIKGGWKHEQF